MKKKLLLLAALALLTSPVLASSLQAGDDTVTLTGQNATQLGRVIFHYVPGGILIDIDLQGLSPGWHAIHIHEIGDCSESGFETAGGHETVLGNQAHGFLDEANPHAGDLPNVWVDSTGTGRAQFFSTWLNRNTLRDNDGSALVVHEGADDYRTEPAGNSGGRVACGVISPEQP